MHEEQEVRLIEMLVPVKVRLGGLFQDMESELRAFAARPEHKSSDSTFLVFMSHGILSGICGTKYSAEGDPDVLAYDTIFQKIGRASCRERVCQYV